MDKLQKLFEKLWWLSFIDPHLPEGERFLGVAIVEAKDFDMALKKTWELGINPGGQVRGLELEEENFLGNTEQIKAGLEQARLHQNQLLSLEDLKKFGLVGDEKSNDTGVN